MEKGKFIALEGIDGSGKSSQIGRLVQRIEGLGLRCRADREPTGGPVGSLIRQIFTGRVSADNRVIAALYAADRLDHLVNEVDGLCAAIDQGITVVSDRYYFSSYAYHSVDIDMDWVIGATPSARTCSGPPSPYFWTCRWRPPWSASAKTALWRRFSMGRTACARPVRCISRRLNG